MADLRTFLMQYIDKPMVWGVDDCSLMLADWWSLNHGVDPAIHLRGAYATEDDKTTIVANAGGLVALVADIAAGAGAERTSAPQEGDFGVVRVGETAYAAICAPGGFWAIRSPSGITFTRDARVLRAWSIGQATWPWMGYRDGLTVPHHEDPLSIGIAFLVNIGYTGTITALGATIVGSVIIGAVGLGLSYLSSVLFRPQQTRVDPQQRQVTVRQSIGARMRWYGRVKVGGTLWFFEAKDGRLFNGITINDGEISGIVEYWLNDSLVTLDSEFYVNEGPYRYDTFDGRTRTYYRVAQIVSMMGTDDQAVAPILDFYFDEITAAHRLRGIAYLIAVFDEVPQDRITTIYPQLAPTTRVVMDASLVKNINTGTIEWSDSPADCIYDYLTAVDGAGFARGPGFYDSEIELSTFQERKIAWAENVPLKAGGSIPRYRLWGGYGLNEEMRDVLPRMLATCDGDLYLTKNGKVGLRGGTWTPPVLTLDDTLGHIVSHEFGRGQGALAAYNELTTTYLEPELDYQEVEAERWVDVDNLSLIGRTRTSQLSLQMVPHHAQARRLAKIKTHKDNPRWQGKVVTNFYGFNAIDERTVRLKIGVLQIDEDFLIRKITILPGMTGVELQLSSLSAAAYEWDAELEEGTGPTSPPDTGSPPALHPPTDINVSVASRVISGGTGAFLIETWTEPTRTALSQQVQYRTSPDGVWQDMSVSSSDGLAESAIVNDGEDYDVQTRTRSPGGATGEWSTPITITATPDTTTPGPVTGIGVSSGSVVWTQPTSTNSIGARIYRGTTSTFGSATLVATVYGSPGVAKSLPLTTVPGTYWYFVTSINGSGGESTSSTTGALVVI